MKKRSIYKRAVSLALVVMLVVGAAFCMEIPVNAATTIRNERITATVQASSTAALRIRWNRSSLAQGYVIYRRESVKLPWKRIRVVSGNATSYLDRNLTSGKPYQYGVRAYRRENGKNVYSIFTPVIGATRPLKTTVVARAVSSNRVNISWTRVTRCDGYYVYRRAAGEKWKQIAVLNRTRRSMADTTVSGGTKYVYCVRAYKKGGNIKYLAPMTQSRIVTTPGVSVSSSKFLDVMKNILYAVETGGQIYGNQVYDDFTEAYTNSSAEHAITIGAGQWYATEAQRLLKLIHDRYPSIWKRYDSNNLLWKDVLNENWSTYTLTMSSKYKKSGKPSTTDDWKIYRIKLIIGCSYGQKCQDYLMEEQIKEYEKEIRSLKYCSSLDSKALGMLINVRHQGGLGSVTRILNKTKRPYTLDSIYQALGTDRYDHSSDNQVGDYWTRQQKVYSWLKNYMN